MATPEDVLAFWLDEITPEQWYTQDDALDATIQSRFGATLEGIMEGRHGLWLTYPSGALAYIIVTDQFTRNMFRADPRAFDADHIARAAAKQAIHRGWDMKIDLPARQFFYMPLMHSETLSDQDRCVRLMKDRMGDSDSGLLHARVHREIIRLFGRFPYRNAALGRSNSPAEQTFLESSGYGDLLRDLQAAPA